LTLAPVGGEWSASRPCRFTPGERAPGSPWIGGWVDPRAGLDDMEKRKFVTLILLELRPLGILTRSQSLCLLRSPGSQNERKGDTKTFLLAMGTTDDTNHGSAMNRLLRFISLGSLEPPLLTQLSLSSHDLSSLLCSFMTWSVTWPPSPFPSFYSIS
jgi:hypothetical protein